MKKIVFTLLLLFWQTSYAAIETKTGVINQLQVFSEGNFAFRVVFAGGADMCSLGENWAYIESSDSNYDTKVSALMAAFAMGATVTIYTEASSRNHCQLKDIVRISR